MSEVEEAICVVIADDHPATREGIRTILDAAPDIEVVGEAEDGREAQEKVAALQPDILLLDLVMPDLRPAEIQAWVRTHHPETTTLVLTAHDRDAYLAEVVKAGAAGYLTKDEGPQQLITAIRSAARGEVLLTPEQWARIRAWEEGVGARWQRLSAREREVLVLLAEGKTTAKNCGSLAHHRKHRAYPRREPAGQVGDGLPGGSPRVGLEARFYGGRKRRQGLLRDGSGRSDQKKLVAPVMTNRCASGKMRVVCKL